MWKNFKKFFNLFKDFSFYFYKGWQAQLVVPYAKAFLQQSIFHLNRFRHSLYEGGIQHHTLQEEKIKKLQGTVRGLHTLLPPDARFSYSVLLPVTQPQSRFLQKSLESVFNQSAPGLEVLIGFTQPPGQEIETLLAQLQQHPTVHMQVFYFSSTQEKEAVINLLAEKASGHFLFVMGEEDWIRPDLFFRYEQTLRVFSEPTHHVLYCDVNVLSEQDAFIPASEYQQPRQLYFPFFFRQFLAKGLLIPTTLWRKVQGLNLACQGAEDEDLVLKLDLAGACYQHLPFCLYSLRSMAKPEKTKTQQAFLQVLEKYTQAKKMEWKWVPGYQAHTARAIPPLCKEHAIQVIIPFKDQKELTLKCIHSVLKQKDVQVKITAVDNRSTDLSIATAIVALGGEVLAVNEPFNYSRLNNLAVKQTKRAADCDVVLFLNNDVELEPDALSEMLRWIQQPRIGMVGCRLHYPDGRLQHGGVGLDESGKKEMRWEHVEKLRHFEEMDVTKTLGIFDAVTAACAMVKRQTFLEVGGFDEIWYPIGYSDTNLAFKLEAKGLKCFYTPYAIGIHYESVSRKTSIEDYENSWWLHQLLIKHQKKQVSTQTLSSEIS